MHVFDRYLFRHLLIATIFTAATLAGIILLTQSLRFLELVMNAGASGGAFWLLTILALPRFFEIILPVALMAATVFVYNRMMMDRELVVMGAIGAAPVQLARPALLLAGVVTVVLWVMTTWLAPVSMANMHQMRQVIKAQYSTLLFREGGFNAIRPGLTVFIRERSGNGDLRGMLIHDSRPENDVPVTILAKRGVVVATPEGQQVLVFDGSRQSVNKNTGNLDRLDFERYTLDLPEGSGPVRQRWKEPDERTFLQLLNPDPDNVRDIESRREFFIEAHRRIVSPLLAPGFTVIALCFLLLGPVDRRGQSWRVVTAIAATVLVQGLYLAATSMARNSDAGLFLMYLLVCAPLAAGGYLLNEKHDTVLPRLFQGVLQALAVRRAA